MLTEKKFEQIINEKNISDVHIDGNLCFQGLQIISKYTDAPIQGAGDDVLWSEAVSTLIQNGITEFEVRRLGRLGWFIEDNTYLACNV